MSFSRWVFCHSLIWVYSIAVKIMKRSLLLSVFLLPVVASAGLTTSEIYAIGLYNTGVDNAGSKISTTSGSNTDPHWQLVETSGLADAFAVFHGAYFVSPTSNWIWKDSTNTSSGSASSGDISSYQLSFDLSGYDAAQTVISGYWGTDNQGEIFLNGSSTGEVLTGIIYENFNSNVPNNTFMLNSGFLPGVNTITVNLENNGSPGGLMVNFTEVQSIAVPEPSVLLSFLTASSLGLLFLRRKR